MADEIIKNIVCLGGGIGTVNLIKGLKEKGFNLSVVVSMADEGGSSGRLRRVFDIPPVGDLISCMASITDSKEDIVRKLLTYRIEGDRYASDELLQGHKIGNIIMLALIKLLGDPDSAIEEFKHIFNIPGNFFPATSSSVSISAKTSEGKEIFGEEAIDLGKYNGKRVLQKVFLHPGNAKVGKGVVEALGQADVIVAGPGDLYTTTLPVLIIEDIKKALEKSSAKKIFIVNVANKPFETNGYKVKDYINAVQDHLGDFPFDTVVVNNNFSPNIPKKYHYHFVRYDNLPQGVDFVTRDLVDEKFPLYHDSNKLAKALTERI